VYPLNVVKQQLGKNVTAATNAEVTIEELLDASFCMLSISRQRKVGDYFFPELLVFFRDRKWWQQCKAESSLSTAMTDKSSDLFENSS
jgi:hypothetical protein